jgi:FkbM family methyltransferase
MNILKIFILLLLDLLRNYIHQPKILNYLKILDLKITFDIGAHEGETLEYLLKIKSVQTIYSFEPQISLYNKLVKKYNYDNRIILNNLALSNNSEEKIFFINSLSSTSSFSLLDNNSLWLKIKNIILNQKNPIKNSIILKTSTIDNYVFRNNIDKINLLKIDTEGHELEVLMGAKITINKNKVKYLLIEIHSSKMYKNYSKNKIEEFLKKNNFILLKTFKFPFHPFVDNLYKYIKPTKKKNQVVQTIKEL